MSHVLRRTLKILAVVGVLSCGGDRAGTADYAVRDSAGVRIAENAGPEWDEGTRWVVSSRPSVDIGIADGDPHYLFSRVETGRLLSGGAFVVVNRGTNTLRRYSANGTFEWEAAGKGDGPGEFGTPAVLHVAKADTLRVFDTSSGRLSVFSPRGTFLGATSLRVPGILTPYVSAVAVTDDGSIVALTSGSSPNTPDMGLELGIRRPLAFALGFDGSGAFVDTLAVLPGTEAALTDVGFGIAVAVPPYGHVTSYAVRDTDIVVGTGDHLEVEVWSPAGVLREVMRGPDADVTLTEGDVSEYRDWYVGRLPESQRAGSRRVLDAKIYPEAKAVFSFVYSDPDGNVWLGVGGPDRHIPSSWMVFSAEGRLLGDVALPAGLRVLDFGSSAVLGVWTDELGVEHLRVHAIQK